MTDEDSSAEGDSRPRSSTRPSGENRTVELDISLTAPAWEEAAEDVSALAERSVLAALTHVGVSGALEISLLLTDDAAQRALNRDHRGKDSATNVLSFPAGFMPPAGPRPLGDISLALETVVREAAEQDKSVADHVSHLLVHGTLHLLGYDHGDDAEAEEMEALEREILAGLGIADPYAGGEPLPGDARGAAA
ncbi:MULTISPECIES: rRNA maturation RNase YbeY [Thalassobaculum]|uniref:Endoribonuclease YbeY n=1 Tax=Thalassobaculum litoreum DSM 18839 TaxID=1123362 RepID=A0A8G2BHP6_9PROT|nr:MULTISPECIES: rRNA maturation RNase YbeY [Thalassobaculum]SDF75031.1 probable rRNA maturation factor [Thalassobaculum litoreum DSM 18839]